LTRPEVKSLFSAMTDETCSDRGRGRPRDHAKDLAIREASWRLIAERGYDNLTFEAVAESAQCSRATLYRRFTSKLDLADALLAENAKLLAVPPTPDAAPREALLAYAASLGRYGDGKRGRALLSIADAAGRNPELLDIMNRHVAGGYEPYVLLLSRALPHLSKSDIAFVLDTFVGMIMHHVATLHAPLDPDRLALLTDAAMFLIGNVGHRP
jgi:AcrR family transcriptional regulator